MVAAAWDSVSPDTIFKCWKLTEEKGKEKEKEKEKETETAILQQRIGRLVEGKGKSTVDAAIYLAVDAAIETSKEKSDEELIHQIINGGRDPEEEEEEEEEDEEESNPPSLKEAITCVFTLIGFTDYHSFPTHQQQKKKERKHFFPPFLFISPSIISSPPSYRQKVSILPCDLKEGELWNGDLTSKTRSSSQIERSPEVSLLAIKPPPTVLIAYLT